MRLSFSIHERKGPVHLGQAESLYWSKGKSLGFCGTSLDVENFLKGICVLVSSGNIIHMSNF